MGRVSVYPPSGRYQLIVSEMKPLGIGLLHLEFEKIKKRLADEGLFDESRKMALPPFPGTIGIVTSPKGAAIRDMISITGRRYPMTEIVLYPVRVQGEGAADEISGAIEAFNRWGKPDLLIVGRGGGSLEDLWAFNEEIVARAIASSSIPVVSAVGHEIDFTISDLVADLRAPTPSAAAELVVPDMQRLLSQLATISEKMRREVLFVLERLMSRFKYLSTHHVLRRVPLKIEETMQRLDQCQLSLKRAVVDLMRSTCGRLEELSGKLDILSPLATLGRGYSLTRRLPEGSLVHDASTLSAGDMVGVRLRKGEIECKVKKVKV
jgi:exodeoxyribonuclease VII large subunit